MRDGISPKICLPKSAYRWLVSVYSAMSCYRFVLVWWDLRKLNIQLHYVVSA